ncbi:MAG TPA: MFS transporter [Gaiellaceae bacterium]|nr:MFS transporter [Gaiellaceae bacterium]
MFRNRSLLGLLAAELVSLTGSAMTFVALPWFVLATTGSTAKMGWVLAAEMLPIAIVGIPAGSLIARLGGKRTMLVSDAARGPLMLVIPILHHSGHLSFPALLGTTFAIGVFAAPYFASSRLVVPEVAGEDEQAVASVNAVLSGANQITQLAGPVLAGVLIAATSPATVLVVDGCTYVFSFLTIALVVRAGRRVEATERSKGMLAGLRFLMGDSLLGPLMIAACVINFVAQGIVLGVQGLAYFRYDADAHVVGFLFGGFGVGALLGALVAQQATQKVDLLKLAGVAIVAMPLPLFLLSPSLPWGAATVVVGAFAFFTPLVNAPVIGMLTVRTPAELRPKVMTAVMTVATMAGPFGFIAAGYTLRHVDLGAFFVGLPALLAVGGLAMAAILLRNQGGAADDVAVADVAHGETHALPHPTGT